MSKPSLLIVDDDEAIRIQLRYALRDDFTLALAEDRTAALALFRETHPAVVSLDLGLPPSTDTAEEGLKALEEMQRADPTAKVIVVTGNNDRENAFKAVRLGACDFHLKPIDLAQFKVVLNRAAYLRQLETDSDRHFRAEEASVRFEDIVGNHPKMHHIFLMVSRVAKTAASVLIQGESGTGKELIARAIHRNSPRRQGPFVPINCGAIPETLLEAELFGHEKGAFTGAHVQRNGKIELAEGGTLFLDEIAEMPPALQVKLLRFLQEREIERLGGRERIPVDVRIVAASNKDLMHEIEAGRFREDLYYRLSVVTIAVPSLTERGDDILLLAHTFLARSSRQHRRRVKFSADTLSALLAYQWPGNIRELENKVERAVIMARTRVIEPVDLDLPATIAPAGPLPALRARRDEAERETLVESLMKNDGNITRAAEMLGVSRPTFHALLRKHCVNARAFHAVRRGR